MHCPKGYVNLALCSGPVLAAGPSTACSGRRTTLPSPVKASPSFMPPLAPASPFTSKHRQHQSPATPAQRTSIVFDHTTTSLFYRGSHFGDFTCQGLQQSCSLPPSGFGSRWVRSGINSQGWPPFINEGVRESGLSKLFRGLEVWAFHPAVMVLRWEVSLWAAVRHAARQTDYRDGCNTNCNM